MMTWLVLLGWALVGVVVAMWFGTAVAKGRMRKQ